MHIYLKLLLPFLILLTDTIFASELDQPPKTEIVFSAQDGTELTLYQYPAEGNHLVIWVGSSYSLNDRIYRVAHGLARQGVEVWQIDFAEVLFQTQSSNFMRTLDARYIADIIETAHQRTNKTVTLLTRAYGSIPTLRGAHIWQTRNPNQSYLAGTILFSPDLYKAVPSLGQEPEYLSITRVTSVPVMIYQGQKLSTRWQLPRLLEALQQGGANVYFKIMSGVTSTFYEGDTSAATQTVLKRLPAELPAMIRLLTTTPRPGHTLPLENDEAIAPTRLDDRLKPFNGNIVATELLLNNVNGKIIHVHDYKNKVTVINFWATWCPPCVEEIPSLNRLKQKMRDQPFELISINYAESQQQVENFMRRVNVDFPVLLDTSGQVAANWNVIAFPSTFIIGPDGRIRYGVNAAIPWDSEEVITTIKSLAAE